MAPQKSTADGQPKGTTDTARNSTSPRGSHRAAASSSASGGTARRSGSSASSQKRSPPNPDTLKKQSPREAASPTTHPDDERKEVCLGCGKTFKRINRHVCKGRTLDDEREELCHGCGKTFKRINRHVCKGRTLDDEREELCHGCGRTFKRINRHVCKGRTLDDEREEVCHGCGKTFKRINRHVCKGRTLDDEREEVCHGCGKTFKRINRHVCKGQTLDVSGHSSSGSNRPPPARRSISALSTSSSMTSSPLDDEAERIMEELGLNCSSDPRRDTLEFFNKEVQLLKEEKVRVSGSYNTLRDAIIEKLTEETKCDWTFLNSGSSYDGTKVTRPDEFDCMLFPTITEECLKIRLENAPAGYCFVEFHPGCARSADKDAVDYIKKLCVQKGGVTVVRSDLFRKQIHHILEVAVRESRRAKADPKNNPGSPAFAVILNAIPRDNTLRAVSIDFVPGLHLNKLPPGTGRLALKKEDKDAVKDKGFDVTPKQCNRDTINQNVLWRLSFSRAEKHLTKSADSGANAAAKDVRPTCRKEVLRILKRLLEVIKGSDNSKRGHRNEVMVSLKNAQQMLSQRRRVSERRFTTYEIRMLMLREFHVNCPDPKDWTMECRRARLQHALGQLKKMLKGSVVVPHFFLPSVIPNIMADVPQTEREFLYVMFTIAEKLL